MWEVRLSIPQTLEKILKELLSQFQGRKTCTPVAMATENACILHLAVSSLDKSETALLTFSEPCRLCQDLTAGFVSAGGLQ